jgi:hypothetical protein
MDNTSSSARSPQDLVPSHLRHRLVLSSEALADGVDPNELIGRVPTQIPAVAAPTAGEAVRHGR